MHCKSTSLRYNTRAQSRLVPPPHGTSHILAILDNLCSVSVIIVIPNHHHSISSSFPSTVLSPRYSLIHKRCTLRDNFSVPKRPLKTLRQFGRIEEPQLFTMSGLPSGSASSATRPTTNGIVSGNLGTAQQRASDSQSASGSTSNGQSGIMSQSNLNSIVRTSSFISDFYFSHLQLLLIM